MSSANAKTIAQAIFNIVLLPIDLAKTVEPNPSEFVAPPPQSARDTLARVITIAAATIPTRNTRALISRPALFAFRPFRRFWGEKVYMCQRLAVPQFGMGDDGTAGRSAPSAIVDLLPLQLLRG
jgi:hypothetical protein